MEGNRYVAFIDILGFKSMLTNNDMDRIVSVLGGILASINEVTLASKIKTIEEVAGGMDKAIADHDNIKVNTYLVSDAIIVWSNDDSPQAFLDVITYLRRLFIATFRTQLPLRGYLTFGEFAFHPPSDLSSSTINLTSIITGTAYMEAYLNEGVQQWVGCAIDDKCIEQLQTFPGGSSWIHLFEEKKLMLKYDVPCKIKSEMKSINMYTIDWLFDNKTNSYQEMDLKNLDKKFTSHNKELTNDVILKRDNTADFIKFLIDSHNT